jgi:hypothetical protein
MNRGSIMKKITAFLFAVMFAFVLAGCSTQAAQSEKENQNGNGGENTNENTEASKSIVYSTFGEGYGRITLDSITFQKNGTFVFHTKGFVKKSLRKQSIADGEDWHKYEYDEDLYWRSYTGDASKDGEICLTIEKERNEEDEIVDYSKDDSVIKATVSNKKLSIEDYEYLYCVFHTTDIVYEYSDKDITVRITFRADGTAENETIDNNDYYKYDSYYIGNPAEDGIISLLDYEEELINGDELSIYKLTIENNKLYDFEPYESEPINIDYSHPFVRKN